jgi:hypothetical protein
VGFGLLGRATCCGGHIFHSAPRRISLLTERTLVYQGCAFGSKALSWI